MKALLPSLLPILLGTLSSLGAQGVIAIPNPSFELDAVASGATAYGTPTNWSYVSDASAQGRTDNVSQKEPATPLPGMDGLQHVAFYLDNNDSNAGTPDVLLTSRLTSANLGTWAANTTYTLQASFGGVNHGTPRSFGLAFVANGVPVGQTLWSVETLPGEISGVVNFADQSIVLDTATQPGLAGQSLAVQIIHQSTYSYGRDLFADNVRLTAVPEPSFLAALAGLAALGLGWRRSRNFRK